ncbi:MFS transporter [Candidatus Poribacteria bacterium]|jgi:MFS family permease|nr:MFS transporter [Candidatus Poribacteria bacterium]
MDWRYHWLTRAADPGRSPASRNGSRMSEEAEQPNPTPSALRSPAFRWYLAGRVTGSPTGPLRQVVEGWLMYQMTGSAMALAWVSSSRAIAMFLVAPFGGVLSDRFEKRWMMLAARAVLITNALAVVALLYFDALRPWHLAAVALIEGIAFALIAPAMRSVVPELVPRDSLMNAISMGAVVEGAMAIAGGAIAGILIESVTPAAVYLAVCGLLGASCYTLFKLPPGLRAGRRPRKVVNDLYYGVRHMFGRPVLVALVGLSFARNLFGQPYRTFLPAYAQDHLSLDARGLGALTSAMGVGSLVSSLVAASLGNTRHKGRMLLGAGVATGASLILLVTLHNVPAAFVLVALAAGFGSMSMLLTNTLMQSECKPQFRARVSSLGMMLRSLSGLGVLPAGALADRVGVPTVIGVMAALLVVTYAAVGVRRSDLRRLG